MHKILLIIKREYLTRVRKKSFIIMSILGPLLFGSLFVIPIWLATRDNDEKVVQIVNESEFFQDEPTTKYNIYFKNTDLSLEKALEDLGKGDFDALMYIPDFDIAKPEGIQLFSENNLGIEFENNIENILQKEIEAIRMARSGINQQKLDSLKGIVNIKFTNPETGQEEANSGVATFIGYGAAFAIYMFIFIYGAQVMRGVAEEKTNRIVEIIISSVKPFQLMMGKIIGIALVVLTQLSIWIVLTTVIWVGINGYYADEMIQIPESQSQVMASPSAKIEQAKMFSKMKGGLDGINFPVVIFSFIFFFLGGYLMYAALFAMVGAAVDSMEDSQQFMLPITIPLIASIVMLSAVLQEPHGTLATWMSIFPLTSPVIMMMRVPFDVPEIELVISMLLLVVGFLFTTWFAGRIYRIGILMHGSKVSYKVLWKWFFTKQ